MQRPTSVTVFGVLHIVFGLFGFFGTFVTMMASSLNARTFPGGPGQPASNPFTHPIIETWTRINIPISFVVCVGLVVAGIGLLRLRNWARKASIGYAIYSIITTIIGTALFLVFVTIPLLNSLDASKPGSMPLLFGSLVGVVGSIGGLIYPGLLWYFMTRAHVIAAFEGRWMPIQQGEDVALVSPFVQPTFDAPLSDNPYAAPQGVALAPRSGQQAESIVETFVPTKNAPALVAYYLGLFSLFPLMGSLLGVIAVYYGIQGLRRFRENPAVRGKTHAWVGLICGAVFGLGNFALLTMTIAGLVIAWLS